MDRKKWFVILVLTYFLAGIDNGKAYIGSVPDNYRGSKKEGKLREVKRKLPPTDSQYFHNFVPKLTQKWRKKQVHRTVL